jgi:hypothetical protein
VEYNTRFGLGRNKNIGQLRKSILALFCKPQSNQEKNKILCEAKISKLKKLCWHRYGFRQKVFDKGSVTEINDIRKNRGDNPIQDSPVKESAIRLFNENTLIALRLNYLEV